MLMATVSMEVEEVLAAGEGIIAKKHDQVASALFDLIGKYYDHSLMALGGAFLTMSAFDAFFFGMINGRGWVCIALTVFASWRPGKALIGALLFGAFDAFQVRLQTEVGAFLPSQVFLMMPYILSIIALIVVARKADYPKALLVPWFKGQR